MPKSKRDRKEELEQEERNNNVEPSRSSRQSRGEVDFTPVDSYTGEPIPPEPEGDIPLDDMEVETFANGTEFIPLEQDQAVDFLLIDSGENQETVMDVMDDYTDDEDILDDFAERQGLSAGAGGLIEELIDHNSKGPRLSGGDVDAAWEDSDVSGEESVGGTAPTPDQDIVDDVGGAVGVTYDDDEELNTAEKLGERDRNRWELDPRSADEDDEDNQRDLSELDEF
jgi:hypothetical protein